MPMAAMLMAAMQQAEQLLRESLRRMQSTGRFREGNDFDEGRMLRRLTKPPCSRTAARFAHSHLCHRFCIASCHVA
jgi:hypothetical protein